MKRNKTVRAANADVQRWEEFATSVHVLVDYQLRPDADASRAGAGLARARVNLARAQQQDAISRALLAEILWIADSRLEIQESGLLGAMPGSSPEAAPVAGGIAERTKIEFSVPAYPGQTFHRNGLHALLILWMLNANYACGTRCQQCGRRPEIPAETQTRK
jgi:hypothetical protein